MNILKVKTNWPYAMVRFFRNKQTSAPHKLSWLAWTVEYWLKLQSLLWGCGSLRVISENVLFLLQWATMPKCEASVYTQTSGWHSVALWYSVSTMVMGFGKTWQMNIKRAHQSSVPPTISELWAGTYDQLSEMHMMMSSSFMWLIELCGLGWIIDTKCTKLLRVWVTLGRLDLG